MLLDSYIKWLKLNWYWSVFLFFHAVLKGLRFHSKCRCIKIHLTPKQTHREQAYGCQMGGADGEKIKQEKQI